MHFFKIIFKKVTYHPLRCHLFNINTVMKILLRVTMHDVLYYIYETKQIVQILIIMFKKNCYIFHSIFQIHSNNRASNTKLILQCATELSRHTNIRYCNCLPLQPREYIIIGFLQLDQRPIIVQYLLTLFKSTEKQKFCYIFAILVIHIEKLPFKVKGQFYKIVTRSGNDVWIPMVGY